ncbi:hypothetical protein TNCV_1901791 [Trichonephila clavipes]|nr:hypothetical protein TNCV_1901791 [Trichonephila clavipes]
MATGSSLTQNHSRSQMSLAPSQDITPAQDPIPWKFEVWDDVSIANPVLSQEELIINTHSLLRLECGEKIPLYRGHCIDIFFFLQWQ